MSIAKPKVFWPLIITALNQVIYYKLSGVDYSVNIAQATYLSAETFRAAVQTALRTGTGMGASTAVLSSTGVFTFANGTAFQFRWNLTTFHSARALLGYVADADTASATSLTADCQLPNAWYSPVACGDDGLPVRDRLMDVVTRTMAGQTKYLSETELVERMVIFRFLPAERTYIQYEAGATTNQAIERWWDAGRSRFRYWPDGAMEGTSFDYVLDLDTIKKFAPKRMERKKAIFEVTMGCFGFVA